MTPRQARQLAAMLGRGGVMTVRCATYAEARAVAPASMRLSIVCFVDGDPTVRDWVFRMWSLR